MTGPRVTIGLPVYNGENYLQEAISSILAQSFADYRLIIGDNASTDGTEEICRAAARGDSRIEYYRHETNLGAAANYNFAVDQTSSPYFMWHAHDDLRHPRFLEQAISAHDLNPDTSIVFSRARRIGPDGEQGELMERPVDLMSALPTERIRAAITCKFPDIPLFGLMRTEMLRKTGKHGNFKGGDRLLVAEMAMIGKFIELDDVLFFNRDHPSRYVRMSGSDRNSKSAWWDTTRQTTVAFPRWRGFVGYLRAVRRLGPRGFKPKVRVYAAVMKSITDNRFYLAKQLLRDLAGGLLAALGDVFRRSKARFQQSASHQ